MALTLEQQKYYDELDNMFATDGWKNLVEEMKTEIYQTQADALDLKPVPGVSMDYLLGKLQGKGEILAYIANLEAISDGQKEILSEDDEP